MAERRNDYDVTNKVKTTEAQDVSLEISRIYQNLYQQDAPRNLNQAFTDLARLYQGEYPGYHECDTDYHDIQHVLDVTLGMGRLLDGCARATSTATITERLFRFGIITALYHDCGYIRHRKDTKHSNGAEYTAVHVSRGARLGRSQGAPGVGDTRPGAGGGQGQGRVRGQGQSRSGGEGR